MIARPVCEEVGDDVDDVDVVDAKADVPEDVDTLPVVILPVALPDVVLAVEVPDVIDFKVEVGAEPLKDAVDKGAVDAPGIESGPGTYFVLS